MILKLFIFKENRNINISFIIKIINILKINIKKSNLINNSHLNFIILYKYVK